MWIKIWQLLQKNDHTTFTKTKLSINTMIQYTCIFIYIPVYFTRKDKIKSHLDLELL